MRTKFLITIAMMLAMAGGCAQEKKKPTQKEVATKQWNAARANVLGSLAKDQYQTGNFDKSRQTVNEALRMDPQSATLRILSAKLAIEQGQLELAEKELKLAREADPKSAEADYLSGVVCQRWQKADAAYDFYTAASDKAPTELAYLMARAEMLVTLDKPADALAILNEKVVYFEHSAAIRDAVGQLQVRQGQYAEAAEMLRQASILAGDDPVIHEHLAMALYYANRHAEAADVLSRLVKREGYENRSDLLAALGECQLQSGKNRDARANFDSAAKLNPASPGIWMGLAKASMQLNDYDRADLSIRKCLAIDPASNEAHFLMGYLRLRQNRLSEALVEFRKSSALDSGDTVSLCMIGYVMEKTGRGEQAMRYYAQALKIRPNDELASRLMAGVDLRE